jgi:hypothetical protein
MLLQWNNTGGAGGISVPWSSTPTALLPPGFSLTRASTGTYFDSAGLLQTAAIDAARGTYRWNGSAWVFDGTIVEAAATNLCLQSQDLTTTWTKSSGGVVSANATTAPDGTSTADLFSETAVSSQFFEYQIFSTAADQVLTASVFFKYGTKQYVVVNIGDGVAGRVSVAADLIAGTITEAIALPGGTYTRSSITACANGWYRVEVVGQIAAGRTDPNLFVGLSNSATPGGFPSYLGTSQGSYIWGAQFEVGNGATSYIPTTTASVPRSADVLTAPTSGLLVGTDGFTAIGLRPIVSVTTGDIIAATNKPMSLNAGQLSLNDGTAARDFAAATLTVGTTIKLATTWSGSASNGAVNGTVGTSRAFDGNMGLGATITLMGGVSGVLQSLRLGTRGATDSELAAWTS